MLSRPRCGRTPTVAPLATGRCSRCGRRGRRLQNQLIAPNAKHYNVNFIENLNSDVVFCLAFVNDMPLPNLSDFFNSLVQVRPTPGGKGAPAPAHRRPPRHIRARAHPRRARGQAITLCRSQDVEEYLNEKVRKTKYADLPREIVVIMLEK